MHKIQPRMGKLRAYIHTSPHPVGETCLYIRAYAPAQQSDTRPQLVIAEGMFQGIFVQLPWWDRNVEYKRRVYICVYTDMYIYIYI